jgi:HSP20 family molecular chaperone IbpA
MSRMFEDMLTAITRFPWVALPPEALAAAKTEVSETDKEISIVAELPGVSQQDLEVSLDDDVLTIRAETRGESTLAEPDATEREVPGARGRLRSPNDSALHHRRRNRRLRGAASRGSQ